MASLRFCSLAAHLARPKRLDSAPFVGAATTRYAVESGLKDPDPADVSKEPASKDPLFSLVPSRSCQDGLVCPVAGEVHKPGAEARLDSRCGRRQKILQQTESLHPGCVLKGVSMACQATTKALLLADSWWQKHRETHMYSMLIAK